MRKAVIDLGTNTFNLLIADVYSSNFNIIHSDKEGVALGMGGINENKISSDAFERGIATLRKFKSICDELNVESINAFGTSALRGANNSTEFVEKIKKELNFDINIISGNSEAEFIYKGVKWSYNFEKPGVIMDIGGGSTEFIFADKFGMQESVSLDIGVSRIYQEFKFNDPLSVTDIQTIIDWLELKSSGFFDNKKSDLLIGASGTFETFYELIHHEAFPELIHSVEIPIQELKSTINSIIASTQAERDLNDFIIPIRKKMAPIAAVKVKWIIEKLGIKEIIISPCSLKEGALSN